MRRFQFSFQFFQFRNGTGIQNQVPSLPRKFTGTTLTNSATGAGYKNNLSFHYVLIYNIRKQKYALTFKG